MSDQQLGRQLREVANDVVRLGAQAFNTGRTWLNERREDMHQNNEEHGSRQPAGRGGSPQQASQHQPEHAQSRQGARENDTAYRNQMNQGELYGRGDQYGQSHYGTSDYGQQSSSGQGYGSQFQSAQQDYGQPQGGSPYSAQGAAQRYGQQGYGSTMHGGQQPSGTSNEHYGRLQGNEPYGGANQQSRMTGQGYGASSGYGSQAPGFGQTYASNRGFGSQGMESRDRETLQGGFGASQHGAHGGYSSPYSQQGGQDPWQAQSGTQMGHGGLNTQSASSRYSQGGPDPAAHYQYGQQGGGFGHSQFGAGSGSLMSQGVGLQRQEYGQGHDGGYSQRSQSTYQPGGMGPSQYGQGGMQGIGSTTGSELQSRRGRGPKNYTRSDERILDDLHERLSSDPQIDASEVEVRCEGGQVTLEGTVEQRWMKHRIEDIAEACAGVRQLDNRIRVESQSSSSSQSRPTSAPQTGTTAGKQAQSNDERVSTASGSTGSGSSSESEEATSRQTASRGKDGSTGARGTAAGQTGGTTPGSSGSAH
ncbi:MAG: BON domain-containing protein [Lysobacter sp.]|nr:MAG: BON domain-containing protein [Lysobacter sp.]